MPHSAPKKHYEKKRWWLNELFHRLSKWTLKAIQRWYMVYFLEHFHEHWLIALFTVWQCSKVRAIMPFTFMHHIVINITQKYQIQSEIIMNFKLFCQILEIQELQNNSHSIWHLDQFSSKQNLDETHSWKSYLMRLHIFQKTWWDYIFLKKIWER